MPEGRVIEIKLTFNVGGKKIPIKSLDVAGARKAIVDVLRTEMGSVITDAAKIVAERTGPHSRPLLKQVKKSKPLSDAYDQAVKDSKATIGGNSSIVSCRLGLFNIGTLDKLLIHDGDKTEGKWWRIHEHGTTARVKPPGWSNLSFVPIEGAGTHGEGKMVKIPPGSKLKPHPGIKPMRIMTVTNEIVKTRLRNILPVLGASAMRGLCGGRPA
jgi:hypothetical protein